MSAQIIEMEAQDKKEERICAFCLRLESQVKKLIHGIEQKCICDECIAKATRLLSYQGVTP